MKKPQAFLFDLNGTMIDDMSIHLDVWYDVIVNELGADLSREQVKKHMYGKGQEVLCRIFGEQRFTAEELDRISLRKEEEYQRIYRPQLDLISGLFSFLQESYEKKIKMAIGSAATPFNINFVLDALKIRHYFDAIVSADDVAESKPHPETFLKAAHLLNVSPSSCIVFEDAPKGVEAAHRAGMKSVVLTTMHDKEEFSKYDNILMFVENYRDIFPHTFQPVKIVL